MNISSVQTIVSNCITTTECLWRKRAYQSSYKITEAWLRGFIEAEGSFSIQAGAKQPAFTLSQHVCDIQLMWAIRNFLGCGDVYSITSLDQNGKARQMSVFTIRAKDDIRNKVIPLFSDTGFVLENKRNNYSTWLHQFFPNIVVPAVNLAKSYNLGWLAGFTDGDGSFYFPIDPVGPKQSKTGFQIRCGFDLAQKVNKEELSALGRILFKESPFECFTNQDGVSHIRVTAAKILKFKVLPLFLADSLQSRKSIDFVFWKIGLELMEKKYHLTLEGLKAFQKFKILMDKYRITPPPQLEES